MKDLTTEQKGEMDKHTPSLPPALRAHADILQTLHDAVDGLRASEFMDFTVTVDKSIDELGAIKKSVAEHYDAVAFLKDIGRTSSRAAKAAVRYQKKTKS